MDWLKMPPLPALRAFAAFAETGNVSDAGGRLNVSHAAISQQLRALERHLGVALLDRSGRALELTRAGQRLAYAVELGFGAIGAAIEEIAQGQAAAPVHVSLTPMFAASWLMPRLAGFRQAHPDIDLTLDPSPNLVDLRPGGVDLALRYGDGNWPGVEAQMLLRSPIVVVAAPDLLQGRSDLTAEELAELPWLEELGTTEATRWLATHGVKRAANARRMHMPGNLILDGARAGQGVTATARHFVLADIGAGRLVELFREHTDSGYHIVTGMAPLRPAARIFVRWLKQQGQIS